MLKSGTNIVSIVFDVMPTLEAHNYRISASAHLVGIYLVYHMEYNELIKDI